MVLTESDIFFAKPDSDVVLDKFPLKNISYIGKVDQAQDALGESGTSSGAITRLSDRVSKRASKKNRNSVKFSTALKMDRVGDLQVHCV